MKGTRCSVLRELQDWLHYEQSERADGILGASFFCSRESDARSNVQFIIPTLVFQLAHRYPRFREELLKILRGDHDVVHESLHLQVEKLIVSPFEATQIQTLIIIDALDECDDRPATFLSSLTAHMAGIPNVKFFVTGRPPGKVQFRSYIGPPVHCAARIFRLHRVKRSLVDDDIKLILGTRWRECAKAGGY